jgi:hypothetical protein
MRESKSMIAMEEKEKTQIISIYLNLVFGSGISSSMHLSSRP